MEKVRPWCGQPSDRGRLRNRTEENRRFREIYVMKTLSACFAVLWQLQSISVSDQALSWVACYISLMSQFDYENATLAGIPSYLPQRLQSVTNLAAWMIYNTPHQRTSMSLRCSINSIGQSLTVDWLHAGHPCLQMSTWTGACLSCWWTPTDGDLLKLISICDHPFHHHWWSSRYWMSMKNQVMQILLTTLLSLWMLRDVHVQMRRVNLHSFQPEKLALYHRLGAAQHPSESAIAIPPVLANKVAFHRVVVVVWWQNCYWESNKSNVGLFSHLTSYCFCTTWKKHGNTKISSFHSDAVLLLC